MARRSVFSAVFVVMTGLACAGLQGKPVPADRADLVGSWSGTGVDLDLTADGGVHYEKTGGGGHVEINGPVTEWTEDGFVVGVFGVGTTFRVEEEPHQVDDHWETTIDGMRLSRPSTGSDPAPERRGGRGRKAR